MTSAIWFLIGLVIGAFIALAGIWAGWRFTR